jgi:hypothetical protein
MACREAGITEQAYYRSRKEYGGMKTDQDKRLKELEQENANLNRAMSHEAGHAVIGMHFGFDVAGIAVTNRLPHTSISDLDAPDGTPEQRYIFLAAGIASETLFFGDYDRQAIGSDQRFINERGGGVITDYVPAALEILRANKGRLKRIKDQLALRWISARAEAQFSSDPDSYELLSRQELDEIWQES